MTIPGCITPRVYAANTNGGPMVTVRASGGGRVHFMGQDVYALCGVRVGTAVVPIPGGEPSCKACIQIVADGVQR